MPTLREKIKKALDKSVALVADVIWQRTQVKVDSWDGVSEGVDFQIIVNCVDLFEQDAKAFDEAVDLLLETNAEFTDVFHDQNNGFIQLSL